MIYITGDTHCPTGMDKLNETNFPQQKHMTKKDYVIICGGFLEIFGPPKATSKKICSSGFPREISPHYFWMATGRITES